MSLLLANYHTHTSRCFHAVGSDADYVEAALDAGYQVLGFSDHSPWPFSSGFRSHIRMHPDQLSDYIASVCHLREVYEGRITLHLGLEAEYFPRYRDWLLSMRDQGIEYYVLGQHYADSEEDTPYTGLECKEDDGVLRYAESTVAAIRTGLFAYLAHPDLFMRHRTDEQFNQACEEASDMICQACLEMHLPIEYNPAGLIGQMNGKSRGYPSTPFWEYARKYHNPVILGVDAHDPAHLTHPSARSVALQTLDSLGYTVIDRLPMDSGLSFGGASHAD